MINVAGSNIPHSLMNWTDNSVSLQFYNQDKYFFHNQHDRFRTFSSAVVADGLPTHLGVESNILDIRSPRRKIFIDDDLGMYGAFFVVIPKLVRLKESFPDALILFSEPLLICKDKPRERINNLIFTIAKKLKIDILPLDPTQWDAILVNNFAVSNNLWLESSISNVGRGVSAAKSITDYTNNKPTKIAYLSRRHITKFKYEFHPGLSTDIDYRIEKEEILEQYLSELGVEIIIPEHTETLEDQINYFKDVKVLISATSSGIANAVFMNPGGLIVEIATPFIGTDGRPPDEDGKEHGIECLHILYPQMAYKLGHFHITIPNYDHKPSTIIANLEQMNIIDYIKSIANNSMQ